MSVLIQSEISEGLRCVVCEQRWDQASYRYLPRLGIWAHDLCWDQPPLPSDEEHA